MLLAVTEGPLPPLKQTYALLQERAITGHSLGWTARQLCEKPRSQTRVKVEKCGKSMYPISLVPLTGARRGQDVQRFAATWSMSRRINYGFKHAIQPCHCGVSWGGAVRCTGIGPDQSLGRLDDGRHLAELPVSCRRPTSCLESVSELMNVRVCG